MKKELFKAPELELVRFQNSDILCSSDTVAQNPTPGDNEGTFTNP